MKWRNKNEYSISMIKYKGSIDALLDRIVSIRCRIRRKLETPFGASIGVWGDYSRKIDEAEEALKEIRVLWDEATKLHKEGPPLDFEESRKVLTKVLK